MVAAVMLAGGLVVFGTVIGMRALDAHQWRTTLVAYRLSLPSGLKPEDVARWLALVAAATHPPRWSMLTMPPLGLEIVANRDGITHYVLLPKNSQAKLLSTLRAGLPSARLEAAPEYLASQPQYQVAAELTMTSRRRPLASNRAESVAASHLASLQPLNSGEEVRVQWALTSAGNPPPVHSASAKRGDAWWSTYLVEGEVPADAEAIRAQRTKQADPLLHAVLRVGIAAPSRARAKLLLSRTWSTLHGPNAPGVSLVRRWLLSATVARRMGRRALPLTRWPLLLSSIELPSLVGFLLGSVSLPGLPAGVSRVLAPSPAVPKRGAVLATSNYPDMAVPLALRTTDRLRHLYVLGPTGTGKSTLIDNLALQDAAAGLSLLLIDPKSDLVEDFLSRVPEDRLDDVVVLDPSATDRPVGFNLLGGLRTEQDKELAVDNVVHIMGELWRSSWGPRTSDVLRSSLLTLVHTTAADGSNFALTEIPELLTNPTFRRFVTSQRGVPEGVRPFWHAYEDMSDMQRLQVIGPAQNKLRAILTRSPLRLMLGQSQGFDISDLFTKRRIVLVPLSKGIVGAETAQLLGALLLALLLQATLARAAVPAAQRKSVMVYVDEFQDVLRMPVGMADMLAQARGLGVGMALGHQELGQLTEAVKSAVLGTVRSQVVFQLDFDDAQKMAQRFAPLTREDLMGLAAYEVAMRLNVNNTTLRPVTGKTLPLPDALRDGRLLAEASRQRYGTPREDVEAALRARVGRQEQTGQPPTIGRRRRGGAA
ncbi:type IV secretion system DNA-binding domain-containing protein [Parafrankia sp. FMc6]|uniref:type IV secretory system conjugative DNA transfer family protein n=1 Tax=Parafrankia soli TaxID=2599596 RepID=UPI0034D68E8F